RRLTTSLHLCRRLDNLLVLVYPLPLFRRFLSPGKGLTVKDDDGDYRNPKPKKDGSPRT
ncbi:Hypothetical predicted protein, partial [Marmota monax]